MIGKCQLEKNIRCTSVCSFEKEEGKSGTNFPPQKDENKLHYQQKDQMGGEKWGDCFSQSGGMYLKFIVVEVIKVHGCVPEDP